MKLDVSQNLKKLITGFVNCDVFICYSTENTKEANVIKNMVKNYWGKPFIAPACIEGGKDSKEEIQSNIESADIFIPIISSSTTKSAYTHQEIGYAQGLKKDILPVVIGEIDKKRDLGFLENIQYEEYGTEKLKSILKKRINKKIIPKVIFWVGVIVIILNSFLHFIPYI